MTIVIGVVVGMQCSSLMTSAGGQKGISCRQFSEPKEIGHPQQKILSLYCILVSLESGQPLENVKP